VLGEAGLQNPERRRTIHLRARHVVINQHFADWKVKGRRFSNFSKLQNVKPQNPEIGTSTKTPIQSFRYRDLEESRKKLTIGFVTCKITKC
jgi:hypothetical protein